MMMINTDMIPEAFFWRKWKQTDYEPEEVGRPEEGPVSEEAIDGEDAEQRLCQRHEDAGLLQGFSLRHGSIDCLADSPSPDQPRVSLQKNALFLPRLKFSERVGNPFSNTAETKQSDCLGFQFRTIDWGFCSNHSGRAAFVNGCSPF